MADLNAVEKLICERYNVSELPGSFITAMDEARAGDVTALRDLIAEREFYRYREPIDAAMAVEEEAAPEPEGPAETTPPEPAKEEPKKEDPPAKASK